MGHAQAVGEHEGVLWELRLYVGESHLAQDRLALEGLERSDDRLFRITRLQQGTQFGSIEPLLLFRAESEEGGHAGVPTSAFLLRHGCQPAEFLDRALVGERIRETGRG